MNTNERPAPYDPAAAKLIYDVERSAREVNEKSCQRLISEVRQELEMGVNMPSERVPFRRRQLNKLEKAYALASDRVTRGQIVELQADILERYEDNPYEKKKPR